MIFMCHLAEKIAAIYFDKSHCEMLGYMHTRMHFAVLGATNLCIRGSRVRRMEIEVGVGLLK